MPGFPEADEIASSINLSSFRSDNYAEVYPTIIDRKVAPYKGSIFKNIEDPRSFEFIAVPPPPQVKLNRHPVPEKPSHYQVKGYMVKKDID